MARNRLTVTRIKSHTKPGKLADGDGLYLQTGRTGSQSWVFVFIRQGRRRELGLGSFGAGTGQVSLAAARVKADEIREILGRDGDPFTELSSRRVTGRTFGEAADEFIKGMESGWRNDKHRAQWLMTLGDAYCKALRARPVADVNTDDVIRVLKPIWTTKAETARRIRGRIERVLDAAKAAGERSGENPARLRGHLDHLLPKASKLQRGHHAALPYADAPAFMKQLRDMKGTAAAALEFAILTAARSGEVRGATWSEIVGDVWVIPAERMKAGREHRVPLSSRALEILDDARKVRRDDLVFPGRTRGSMMSDMTIAAVIKRMNVDATPHGFRSTFRDWAGDETTHPREVAEAALAHTIQGVEAAYRRGNALAKRRALMDDWQKYLGG